MRMVQELRRKDPSDTGGSRVARHLGAGLESLHSWVKQADIDGGTRAGVSTAEQAELRQLRKETAELPRVIDILQAAASFFGTELACQGKKVVTFMQPAASTQLDFGHRSGHAGPVEGECRLRPWFVGALLVGGCAVGVAVVVQRAMQSIDRGVVSGWRDGS